MSILSVGVGLLPASEIVPPTLSTRLIAPSTPKPAGTTLALEDEGMPYTLFIPESWRPSPSGTERIWMHFHTVPWFALQEHERSGAVMPLAVVTLGQGSAVYARPFQDTDRFGRLLKRMASEFHQRGAPPSVQITAVEVSSFSAGYGAVRELLKAPASFALIRRIVLLDSLYAAWAENLPAGGARRPRADQIEVWVPFARAAVEGRKTFVLTHSAVPTTRYASTADCANALLAALSLERNPVAPRSLAAARDPDCPLRSRVDAGNFHIWGYAGTNASAHLTHVRHLADVWKALEERRK